MSKGSQSRLGAACHILPLHVSSATLSLEKIIDIACVNIPQLWKYCISRQIGHTSVHTWVNLHGTGLYNWADQFNAVRIPDCSPADSSMYWVCRMYLVLFQHRPAAGMFIRTGPALPGVAALPANRPSSTPHPALHLWMPLCTEKQARAAIHIFMP